MNAPDPLAPTTLRGVVRPDARTGAGIDLGRHSGLLVAIRHHG